MVICPECNKSFVKTHNSQKYCTKNCFLIARKKYLVAYKKHKRKPLESHVCPVCKTDFLTNLKFKVYCSRNCFIENRRERHRVTSFNLRKKQRNELMQILGSKCVMCGIEDNRLLVFHHINGGGTKQRDKMGQYGMIRHYLRNQKDAKRELEILCANHNMLKERSQ